MSKRVVTLPNIGFYTLHKSLAIMNDSFQKKNLLGTQAMISYHPVCI